MEGLILVWVLLLWRGRWMVTLVHLRLRRTGLLRRLLPTLCLRLCLCLSVGLVLVGAVVIYPALGPIATLSADSAEWGPTILLLVSIAALLVLNILGRHLRLVAAVAIVLEKRVQVVFVLLVGRGQMRTRALALVPLLLLRLQLLLLQLIFVEPGIALAD